MMGTMSEMKLFEDKVQVAFLMDFYAGLLSEKTQEILQLSMNEDMSLSEIATLKGISRQAVHDSIRRGEESLLRYERELGLAAKALRSRKLIAELRAQLVRQADTDPGLTMSANLALEKLSDLFWKESGTES